MSQKSALSMEAGEWRRRMSELSRDCAEVDAGEQADMLRQARALFVIAPGGGKGLAAGSGPHSHDDFESLLAVGAWESAALDLMPFAASYMLSRAQQEHCIATVLLPGLVEEVSSRAETVAMALVSALAGAFAILPEGARMDLARFRFDERDGGARVRPSVLH